MCIRDRDYPNVVSVFITANDDDKLKRLQDLYKVDASKAKDIMIKTDKQRASYYNYYSNKKWSDPRSYDPVSYTHLDVYKRQVYLRPIRGF